MCSRNQAVAKAVCRDYWRIEVVRKATSGDCDLLVIAGRRRTTEPFWAGLALPLNETARIVAAVGRAAALADQIVNDRRGQAPLFPAHEVIAFCRGPFYVIELAETTCADNRESVLFTLLPTRGVLRPAVYLIDNEIHDFLADLENFLPALESRFAAIPAPEAARGELVANGHGRRV